MTRRRRPAPPPQRLGQRWTTQRAMMAGIVLGLAAVIVANWAEDALVYPYAALVLLTFLCGASILWIIYRDVRARERGVQVRPIRMFDVAIGLAIAGPSAYALWKVWPALGL